MSEDHGDTNSSSSPQVVLGPPSSQMVASSGDMSSTRATTKPLTMFYNGSVTVFHLTQDKAEDIMNMAGQEEDANGGGRRRLGIPAAAISANDGEELLAKLRQELPIASKRSLRRFFQKRNERSRSERFDESEERSPVPSDQNIRSSCYSCMLRGSDEGLTKGMHNATDNSYI